MLPKLSNKGEQTRQRIIAEAARIFNAKGFASASIADIMEATKLQKGGIYRYFESKEALSLAAFDFAYNRLRQRYKEEVFREPNAANRLQNILSIHASLFDDPYLKGGCPILNTAIDSSNTQPGLQKKATFAMNEWRNTIRAITAKGITRQELQQNNTEDLSTIIIASLEGAVMLSQLYADKSFLNQIITHLKTHIQSLAIEIKHP